MKRKKIWNIFLMLLLATFLWNSKAIVNADVGGSDYLYIGGQYYRDLGKNLSGSGWTFQAYPRTITLNNYTGTEIELFTTPYKAPPCDLILKGNNKITVTNGHALGDISGSIHSWPIYIIADTTCVTGGGNLTIDYRGEWGHESLQTHNTFYVNCGTIKMVSNIQESENQGSPFEGTRYFEEDSSEGGYSYYGARIYNTNLEFENIAPEVDHYEAIGNFIYNSNIILHHASNSWEIEKDDIEKNVKLYGSDGNELSFIDDVAEDLHYTKYVYGSDIKVCVPGTLEKYTNASGGASLRRKCIVCGKNMCEYQIPIWDIRMDPSTCNVIKGDKVQLKVKIDPAYLDNQKITWVSEKPDVVSVDTNGLATVNKAFDESSGVKVYAKIGDIEDYCILWYRRKPSWITASDSTKTYSTQAQSFSIGAKYNGDATLKYSSNNTNITVNSAGKVTVKAKYVGSATITVKAAQTDKYQSAVKKITVTVNPSKTSIIKATNLKGKKLKVTWKKNTSGSGYQIQYSTSKTFAKGNKSLYVKKNSIVKATISKLTKGKTYYVRMRTYKTVSGKKYYSAWSKVKTVKISK